MKTLHQWLRKATQTLEALGISSARIDAELILAAALNQNRGYLVGHVTDPLDPQTEAKAAELLQRRKNFEPIAFILGEKEFYGLPFKTDARALIPRGESEPLVETVLAWLRTTTIPQTVAEVGTGSGAIICAIATNAPKHTYYATEVSREALSLAKENATALGVDSITFLEGNLAEPLLETLPPHSLNLLAVNLPYIPSGLLINLDPTIRYFEPDLALDGGEDGLALYRQLFGQLSTLMAPYGFIVCEHERDQAEAMRALALNHFPDAVVTTKCDHLGDDRILVCQL